jgi:sphingolipid delta-4 desaturase
VLAGDYIRVTTDDPHLDRGRRLLEAHPELRELAGPMPASALWVVGLAALQCAVAIAVGNQPWWIWLPTAYIVGATIDHALWVLVHDCAHNLVLGSRAGNRLVALTANLPLVFPAAMSFCKYHLLHHRHLGDLDFDADLPGPVECRTIGDSSWAKAAWLASFAVVQGVIRPNRLKNVRLIDRWTIANALVQIAAVAAFVAWAGWQPLAYLIASTLFAVGFHPLGARWIQEHYIFEPGQETYSYYGPLNRVAFNVGYHNEHHDLVSIPWARLPLVRSTAPEFYDPLHAHRSWTRLLFAFLRDRRVTLFSRIVR